MGVSASISCGVDPQVSTAHFAGAIKLFVQEQLPQIQPYHPDVEIQEWSVQIDHFHLVLVIPPKYAVSSMVGQDASELESATAAPVSRTETDILGGGVVVSGVLLFDGGVE